MFLGSDNKVYFTFDDLSAQPVSNEKPLVHGSELNMAVAVIVTLTIAATLGFFVGYRFSRWRTSNLAAEYASSSTSSASGPCYAPAKHTNDTRMDLYGGGDAISLATSPVSKFEDEAANLVLSLSRDEQPDAYPRAKGEHDRFLNTMNNGTGPMPKEYKVKKVYV